MTAIDLGMIGASNSQMKKVILLRHAKSSWTDPSLDDHDRPLNQRGKAAVPVIARWLSERKIRPDKVVSSSSRRALQTAKILRKFLPDLPEPDVEPSLYHASPTTMMRLVQSLPKSSETVVLIGHQPGLSAFARQLSKGKVRAKCRAAFEHFPTAAAAVIDFESDDWEGLGDGDGAFVDFAKPRELQDH